MPSQGYFQKILVPIDGTRAGLIAEGLAVEIAKRFESKVTVIHAVPGRPVSLSEKPAYFNVPRSDLDQISEWFVKKGEGIVKNAQAVFAEEGIPVEARLVHGDPAENTINLASEGQFDLIVMSNRGETEAEVFSLGSNAEKISRHAECSVLIVKGMTRISRILAPVDGSEEAYKGLRLAVQLAQTLNAQITMMHVADSGFFGLSKSVAENAGSQILSKVAEEFKGTNLTKRLEFGSPSEKIIEVATKEDYDLVVVGSRGMSASRRFFLGSVSDDVSHHSHCSVLIVR